MSHFKWSPLIGDLRNTNDARSRDLMAVTRVFFPSFLAGKNFLFSCFYFFIFLFCFFTTLQVFLCTELNINAWSFCNTFLSQPLYWTGVTYFPFELSRVISYGPLSFRSLAIVAIKPLFQVPREKPLVPRVVLSRSQV